MLLSHSARRTTIHLRGALALATVALIGTACSDNGVAPSSQRAMSTAQPLLSKNDGGGKFTYDPDEDITVRLGNRDHYIVIPAGAVCDIGKSSYGPGKWDNSCKAEDRRTEIKFKTWTDVNGHPFVEFEPSLRFVPGKVVQLYLADSRASMNDYSEILYCPDNKALACYDESLFDKSLKTVRDRRGKIYRRIKHFSGYNVAAGLDEVIDGEEARWSRGRSGYMVVSGVESPAAQNNTPNNNRQHEQDDQRQ